MEDEWSSLLLGTYIVHVEGESGGHCFGVDVTGPDAVCVYDAGKAYSIPLSAFTEAVLAGVDRSKVVVFQVGRTTAVDTPAHQVLYGLMAGGRACGSTDVPMDFALDDEDANEELLPADLLLESLQQEVSDTIAL